MIKNRALVVDDSKLARFVLKEMLVEQGFVVDAVESAEEALGYLCANRPGVIFMDHTMPGMDGFSAVKAIKKDPNTAMIPIMMYTSKEGEVYCSQARALGAVGVLPKQLKPVHLERVLGDLNLLPDKRTLATPKSDGVEGGEAKPTNMEGAKIEGSKIDTRKAERRMREAEKAELRKAESSAERSAKRGNASDDSPLTEIAAPLFDTSIGANDAGDLEDLARSAVESAESKSFRNSLMRLMQEQRLLLRDDIENGIKQVDKVIQKRLLENELDDDDVSVSTPEPKPPGIPFLQLIFVLFIALLPAFWFATQYKIADDAQQSLQLDLQRFQHLQNYNISDFVNENETEDDAFERLIEEIQYRDAAFYEMLEWAMNSRNSYAFGSAPFGDHTLQPLSSLVQRLIAVDFRGTVKLESHVAHFCVIQNSEDNRVRLPAADLPIDQCKIKKLSESQALSIGEVQTIEFGNYLSNFSDASENPLRIEAGSAGNRSPLIPYPTHNASLKAGEWNKIAQRNNRVVISIIPEG